MPEPIPNREAVRVRMFDTTCGGNLSARLGTSQIIRGINGRGAAHAGIVLDRLLYNR